MTANWRWSTMNRVDDSTISAMRAVATKRPMRFMIVVLPGAQRLSRSRLRALSRGRLSMVFPMALGRVSAAGAAGAVAAGTVAPAVWAISLSSGRYSRFELLLVSTITFVTFE